jgi:hypothetical protein
MFDEQRALFAAHPDDAKKLLAVGESTPDAAVSPVDLGAMTMVVNAMMNLDEFVVVR